MKVLVINAGSSSLKYQVIEMDTETMLCKGNVERIGEKTSDISHTLVGAEKKELNLKKPVSDHKEALSAVIKNITDKEYGVVADMSEIGAVGHRVLHTGGKFDDSVLIDDSVIAICKENQVFGPLHMPANIACIEACKALMPNTPMVAVFDNTFHSTMPQYAYMYAIPYKDYEEYGIRKYGFHGTSHKYVAGKAIEYLGRENSKIITCHLGNGSSLAAVKDGKCIDTSMGLTPLEGVIMGSRSGDLDPAVVDFMAQRKNISVAEVLDILNKKSGFKGLLDGISDFRDITALVNGETDAKPELVERAKLAVDMFGYRIRKYIGSYYAALGGLDCIVLTGGIGENSPLGRAAAMVGLECFGVDFDFELNKTIRHGGKPVEISKPQSKVKVLIIPTNEELAIARDAVRLGLKK